jgi:hypothetical protein
VFHAGTAERAARSYGRRRVLNVTALGATPGEARDRAYARGAGSLRREQMRTDIAGRASIGSARERTEEFTPVAPRSEHEFDDLDGTPPRWGS